MSQSPHALEVTGTDLDVDVYGNLFVLDRDRNIVRLYSKDLVKLREMGGAGWENDQFDRPEGIWARNGIDVFVADYGNHRIQRFDRNLNYISTFQTRDNDNPDERFGYPTDVALSRLGDLFICDSENSRVAKVDRFNQVERVFGGFDAGKGRLRSPKKLEMGPKDYVYVLDGARVVVYDNFGNYVHHLAGEMFRKPSVLFADNEGIVVLDEDVLYCFDQEERPAGSIPLASVIGENAMDIRSMVFASGSLYLLTSKGLLVVPDPRPGSNQLLLDK